MSTLFYKEWWEELVNSTIPKTTGPTRFIEWMKTWQQAELQQKGFEVRERVNTIASVCMCDMI